MSDASIVAEVEGVGGQHVSAQTIRRTLHQIGLHSCCPRRKTLLKMMHKKACKQFAEDKQTKDMDYWNYFLWSDETNINLFGSDVVKRVWRQPGEEYKCSVPWAHRVRSRARSIPWAQRVRSCPACLALACCSTCATLAPVAASVSRPSSTTWAWSLIPPPTPPLLCLRSGHHRIFRHDSGSKRTYYIRSAYKCVRHELKFYISEVYDVTLVCAWICWRCQSEHSSCMVRTYNELIIWIRCVNKERHAKYAGGVLRTGIENRWRKSCHAQIKYAGG